MKVKFIAQGVDSEKSQPAGDSIIKGLENKEFKTFCAFVAFVSKDGINQILDSCEDFIKKGGEVRLYIGVDLHGTSKEALELLLSHTEIKTFIVHTQSDIVYHPKVYTFGGTNSDLVIIGSSNLTKSGLYQNMEANMCVLCDKKVDSDNQLLCDIMDYYNSIILGKSTICSPLSKKILDLLIKGKIVASSKENWRINNKIEREEGTIDASVNEELKNTFMPLKKMKARRSSSTKKIRVDIYENKNGKKDLDTHAETINLSSHCMWIVTGKMTGGSRNILDLSMKGNRDGSLIKGSVEFFGIKKEKRDSIKNIDIIYNGKKYNHNTIFFAEGNSNWRIRLNGEAKDKSKLTDISIPKLGKLGAFQQKILIFEKTNNFNKYKLYIVDDCYIDSMIEMSTVWGYGGNGNGRAYGFIDLKRNQTNLKQL